jgi:uncharacterized protein (DUF1800 family)
MILFNPKRSGWFGRGTLSVLLMLCVCVAADADEVLTPKQAARHVLSRMGFGASPGEVDRVGQMGWQAWVRQQLAPGSIDNEACDKYVREHFPSLTLTMDEVFYTYRPPYESDPPTQEEIKKRNELRYKLNRELVGSVIYRAVHSERRFEEVMAEFWRNHFNVDQNKDEVQYLAAHYEQTVIHRHMFGKFGDMLLASARHPAMLIYLDNDVSQKPLTEREQKLLTRFEDKRYQPRITQALGRQRGLNENYARELMELHTLGVDNENRKGGYAQRDVTELARLLTGWTAGRSGESMTMMSDGGGYGFRFREDVHDEDSKVVLGMTFDGREGEAGGVRFIKALGEHEQTAHFISLKLCRYLVNDNPPAELVDEVARVFAETGGDLTKVYEAVLFSDAFMDPANYRAKFRTPFEFVVASLRATDAEVSGFNGVRDALHKMGQPVYSCVDPTGYADTAEAWLDPGVLVYRWDFALRLAQGNVAGVKVPETFWKSVPTDDPAKLKSALAAALLGGEDVKGWAELERALGEKPEAKQAAGLLLGSPVFQQQ